MGCLGLIILVGGLTWGVNLIMYGHVFWGLIVILITLGAFSNS